VRFYGYGGGYSYGGGGGGGWSDNNNNNGLFNFNGGVSADIKNSLTANALNGFIPGISGTVNTLDSVNLLANGNVNNIVSGQGYNSNPLSTYLKNQYVATQVGTLDPTLTPTLNQLNQFNLLRSIVR
jgi:hypothetical protein